MAMIRLAVRAKWVTLSLSVLPPRLPDTGGESRDGTVLNDLHMWDMEEQRWSGEIKRLWCCKDNEVSRSLLQASIGRTAWW